MKSLILLGLIALARATINTEECGIIINGIGHDKVYLKENIDKPFQLAIDYNTNVLYFSFSTKNEDYSSVGYLNIETHEFGTITGVNGGFANGVDENSHSVYIGGTDGLYKLKGDSTTATNLNITEKSIWQIFSKDALYFTAYPDEEVYVYKEDQVKRIAELENTTVILIGVDNANNFVFYNSSGLFYYTKDDGKTDHIGDYTLNSLTSDNNGNIFFSTSTGIYSIQEKTKEVKIVATINNILGVAIESSGGIIYASDDSIIRLKSNGIKCSENTPI